MGTRFTLLLLALLAAAAPRTASAQTADSLSSMSAVAAASVAPAPLAAAPRTPERPAALVPLYISFAALQTADTASTLRALHVGGSEANPLMASVAGSPAALVGVKAAAAATTIFICERMWKQHRGAAIATMIATNAAYSMVAAHNLRAVGQRLQ